MEPEPMSPVNDAAETSSSSRYLRLLRRTFNDDGVVTPTSLSQQETESLILRVYSNSDLLHDLVSDHPKLERSKHYKYCYKGLFSSLSSGFECMDSSRAWIIYWNVHSLNLLSNGASNIDGGEEKPTFTTKEIIRIAETARTFQSPTGGFGGGPQQTPHLAATFAIMSALKSINRLDIVDATTMKSFLMRMKQPNGSFLMHDDGEVDIRGSYCAMVTAKYLNIMDDDLISHVADWVTSCQTYEGGFATDSGGEAHGGYTFCGLGSLALLNNLHVCDLRSALRWCLNRQMSCEGGFSGRCNKLVDACYSYWVLASAVIIQVYLDHERDTEYNWTFDQLHLQDYLLSCCQDLNRGGLQDKPDKSPDAYHTCYSLSGMAICQNSIVSTVIFGSNKNNQLPQVHPVYNVLASCFKPNR